MVDLSTPERIGITGGYDVASDAIRAAEIIGRVAKEAAAADTVEAWRALLRAPRSTVDE